jgi:hypothetical protein
MPAAASNSVRPLSRMWPRARPQQPGDGLQRQRLARAGGPVERGEGASVAKRTARSKRRARSATDTAHVDVDHGLPNP